MQSDINGETKKKVSPYLYAIRLLAKKDYSEYKLRKKLNDRQFESEEIDAAIETLLDKGYLREDYYAEARIKGLMYKGYSPNYIVQKLAQEHVETTIETILEIFSSCDYSQESQIKELASKKLRGLKVSDPKTREKILRFVLSKGHDYGRCAATITELIEEQKSY